MGYLLPAARHGRTRFAVHGKADIRLWDRFFENGQKQAPGNSALPGATPFQERVFRFAFLAAASNR